MPTESAFAKINLTLDVIGKRQDGYHLLGTVMQSVSLCDKVTVEKADNIEIFCDAAGVPLDRKNTCYKAAELFFESTGKLGGAKIVIEKNIPSEAGLGGGSSDAAAVLRLLNEIYDARLTYSELENIASNVGADVAFCIRGGTSVCKGIGEFIEPIAGLSKKYIILVKPSFGVSTPEAYRLFDEKGLESGLGTVKFLQALRSGKNPYLELSNDLEYALGNEEIAKLRMRMYEYGAEAAQMSGSGSCVFGIFEERESAERAERLFADLPFVRLCRTI